MNANEVHESMINATAQREHEWLHRLVGEWAYEVEAEPGSEPFRGRETVRSLAGLWVLLEAVGSMPGDGEASSLMTLGFDPRKGHYVGTWVGSMMTHLWVYEGRLDPEGRVLELASEGPDMAAPERSRSYKDVIEMVSDDHRTLTGNVLGDDGVWQQIMVAHYRRVG